MKVFIGLPARVASLFNEYMGDKTLSKDVIIQSLNIYESKDSKDECVCIVVIHPNWWDDPKKNPNIGLPKRGNQERS